MACESGGVVGACIVVAGEFLVVLGEDCGVGRGVGVGGSVRGAGGKQLRE